MSAIHNRFECAPFLQTFIFSPLLQISLEEIERIMSGQEFKEGSDLSDSWSHSYSNHSSPGNSLSEGGQSLSFSSRCDPKEMFRHGRSDPLLWSWFKGIVHAKIKSLIIYSPVACSKPQFAHFVLVLNKKLI